MIVVDVETTGIDPKKSCIVSIGAVDYNSDAEFYQECHIYEDSEVHEKALEINGFSLEQLKDYRKNPPHETYYDFVQWALSISPVNEKILLAGHNIGHFDILFLENLSTFFPDKFPFSYRTIDSHTLGYYKFNESLSLDNLLLKLGLPEEPRPHNALTGAQVCKSAIKKILNAKRQTRKK